MNSVKKAWLTEHDSGLCVLSMESTNREAPFKLIPHEVTFPVEFEPQKQRHVITIGMLSDEDRLKLINALMG